MIGTLDSPLRMKCMEWVWGIELQDILSKSFLSILSKSSYISVRRIALVQKWLRPFDKEISKEDRLCRKMTQSLAQAFSILIRCPIKVKEMFLLTEKCYFRPPQYSWSWKASTRNSWSGPGIFMCYCYSWDWYKYLNWLNSICSS